MERFESENDGTFAMGAHGQADITVETARLNDGCTTLKANPSFPVGFDAYARVDSDDPELVAALAEVLGEVVEDARADLYQKGRFTLRLGQVYTRPAQYGMGETKEGQEAVLRVEPPITVGQGIGAIAFGRQPGFNGPKGDIFEIAATSEATLLKIGHNGLGKAALTVAIERLGDGLNAIDMGDLETLTELTQNPETRFEQ